MLALLLECHLGPLLFVKAIWAGRVPRVSCLLIDSHLIRPCLLALHRLSGNAWVDYVACTPILESAITIAVIVQLVIVFPTFAILAVVALPPEFFLGQLVKAFAAARWHLNNARKKFLGDFIELFPILHLLFKEAEVLFRLLRARLLVNSPPSSPLSFLTRLPTPHPKLIIAVFPRLERLQ